LAIPQIDASAGRPYGGRLLDELKGVVELIAAGQGLSETLERIALAVERAAAPAICAIELVEASGRRLRNGASPSLPEAYRLTVHGMEIGPEAGACGTAVHRRTAVVIRDVETDPLFARFRGLAAELGVRACWSMPILDNDGMPIATFALYHRQPCAPSEEEWRFVSGMSGFVRLAVMQHRREEALRAAKEAAETASRAKSQFLAHMSHELRTPLNAILGFSEVIREAMMGPVGPRYRDYAGDIHKAGQHLLSLINDVLDLAKVEVGRLELVEEPLILPDLIGGCRHLVSETAMRAGVTMAASIPADLPPFHGDRLRIKQVVLNLLSNAIKFTPEGGEVRIEARLLADGDLRLTVADTGIGMNPEDVPIALAPFSQLEDPMQRRREGTGLGLPLAKSLVEMHGGRLDVETALGQGTAVSIVLPRHRVLRPAGGSN